MKSPYWTTLAETSVAVIFLPEGVTPSVSGFGVGSREL